MKIRKNFSRVTSALLIVLAFFVPLLFASCATDSPEVKSLPEQEQKAAVVVETQSDITDENPPVQSTDSTPETAPDTARYTVTLTAVWSTESHPGYYESTAHFSPFIAYSHNGVQEAQLFTVGSAASPGIEQMAETGATVLLEEEMAARITGGSVLAFVKGPVFNSPGEAQAELNFSKDFSQITCVSMIAPSPDWFVAAQADLFVDGKWVYELVLELISYDAGTDSGLELTSADADTNPKEPVALFPDYLQRLGALTLTRIQPDA